MGLRRGRAYGEPMSDDAPLPTGTDPAPPNETARRGFQRSRRGRLLGGVCAGLAERLDLDVSIVRVAFAVLAVLWGAGVALYLALWLLVPERTEEGEEPVVAVARRSRLWRLAAALVVAVLAVAVVSLVSRGNGALGGPRPGGLAALAWLAVVMAGAVIVLRSLARRGIWRLLGSALAALVALIVLIGGALFAYLATTGVPLSGGNGARSVQPVSVAQVSPSYRVSFGALSLDLSQVRFPRTGETVQASVAVGALDVTVPHGAVVDLRTRVGLGPVQFESLGRYGWNTSPFVVTPTWLSAAQAARAPHLVLDLQVGIGRIRVLRP